MESREHYFPTGLSVRFGTYADNYVYATAKNCSDALTASEILNDAVASNRARRYTEAAKLMAKAAKFATPA